MRYIVSTSRGNMSPVLFTCLPGCGGAMEIRLQDEKYRTYDLCVWNFIRKFALYKSVISDAFIK